jgi:pantoate--beta-alanine ligase
MAAPRRTGRRGRRADKSRSGRPRAIESHRYLSPAGREAALALSRWLRAGAAAASAGFGPAATLAAAIDEFTRTARAATEPVELDYLVLTAPDLGDAPETGPARLIVAAWIGRDTVAGVPGTRLIDNGPVELV